MEGPRYIHDCDACVFLGRWKEYDLYHHPKIGEANENYIARYGNKEGDYLSGLNIALEQRQAALNGGRLLPLGMGVTFKHLIDTKSNSVFRV